MMNSDRILLELQAEITLPLKEEQNISNVSIDSRTIQPGSLFVAIRGEQFDGHDFIKDAAARGAVAVICEQADTDLVSVPQWVVKDTVQALATIASLHRREMNCPIIALTGSNGKTSVKEMIALILPEPSFATPGNFNNHLGAPLSVLQLAKHHRYGVFELGASHAGEIAHTVSIVQPDVTLINNIAPAHIEGFGSIEGVARAKGEIYAGLSEQGTAIINEDDAFCRFWDDLLVNRHVLRFSIEKPVDVQAQNIMFDENNCATFQLLLPIGTSLVHLQVPGLHSVSNALAAASCCYAAGLGLSDIVNGLNRFQGVAGRMTCLKGKNNTLVIDDTYNANLRSVLTAIDVLAKRPGRRILVLGDMGELGVWAQAHHEEVGRFAKTRGIDGLMTCGTFSEFSSLAFGPAAHHYETHEKLAQDLLPFLEGDLTILVKGSRSARMEKIVHQLVVG